VLNTCKQVFILNWIYMIFVIQMQN